MGVQIKICGLMREADIRYVNRLRPEYAGFVFAPGSRRYVSDEEAGYLSSLLEPGLCRWAYLSMRTRSGWRIC